MGKVEQYQQLKKAFLFAGQPYNLVLLRTKASDFWEGRALNWKVSSDNLLKILSELQNGL
jgi:hypothetical protein